MPLVSIWLNCYDFLQSHGLILMTTIDVLRIWIGPLPEIICTFGIMIKNYIFISQVLLFTSITILKFTFLCVLKRIPEMDDDKVAKGIIRFIVFTTVSIVGSKFWYEKPNMQQVRVLIIEYWWKLQFLKCKSIPVYLYGIFWSRLEWSTYHTKYSRYCSKHRYFHPSLSNDSGLNSNKRTWGSRTCSKSKSCTKSKQESGELCNKLYLHGYLGNWNIEFQVHPQQVSFFFGSRIFCKISLSL